jgi:hypothetical protein
MQKSNRQFVIAMAAAAAMASVRDSVSDNGEELRKVETYDAPRREDFSSRADYRRAVAKFKKGEVYW